jgi:hypothetical protein
MTAWITAGLALAGAALLYIFVVRPRTLTWGARPDEVKITLPGDAIVTAPQFVATRAVTIHAHPRDIWRWIVQIGSGRAGWYSLDWIDNGSQPSAREILPAFQNLQLDQFVPFTPDGKNGMWVKEFSEHRHILWWDRKGRATWLWALVPVAPGETRLLTRLRTRYDFSFPWVIYYLLYDLGDILMMSKCMLGIKERAERESRRAFAHGLDGRAQQI